MREKRLDAPLEERAAIDRQQLLGTRAAEPQAASAGSNDCGYVHWEAFCNLSTVSATTRWTRSASAFASCVVGASMAGG